MSSTRRMGSPDAAVSQSMLDAAETILREEGCCALTSRRVAEIAGVKQRLVYYYHQTMDDLIVATFRRLAAREQARLATALAGDHPLHNVWDVLLQTADARLIVEFMALANRIGPLRSEVKIYIKKTRELQVSVLAQALEGLRRPSRLSPVAAIFFLTSSMLAVNREAELGIRYGHDEIIAEIKAFLSELESPAKPTKPATHAAMVRTRRAGK